MVAQVDIVGAASVFAQNDTAQKYHCPVTQSPEEMENTIGSHLKPMEYYAIQYDYYFNILLENSEQ